MQPVVGVLSDKCTSKLGRRRPFLIVGVIAVVVSFLCLGWCREIVRGIFGEQYPNVQSSRIFLSPLPALVHCARLDNTLINALSDINLAG